MTKDELLKFIENHPDNYSIQLKRKYNNLYKNIDNDYDFKTFGQKIYHYLNGNDIGNCEVCGKICKFDGFNKGYRKRCSYKCTGIDKFKKSHEIRNCIICNKEFTFYKRGKRLTCSNDCLLTLNRTDLVNKKRVDSLKKTLLKRYGVDHSFKINAVVKKSKKTKKIKYGDENFVNVQKAKDTKLKRYGNSNYNNVNRTFETKLKKYSNGNYNNRNKFKKTNMQKYGVEYPMQNEDILKKAEESLNKNYNGRGYSSTEIREKIIKTNTEKYGEQIVTKNKNVIDKLKRTWYDKIYDLLIQSDRLENKLEPMFSKEEYVGSRVVYPFKCLTCTSIFDGKIEDGKIPRCTTCFPLVRNISKAEKEIYNYLLELGIRSDDILTNDRKILNGLELDLYISSKNIAIEYDGMIWHSEFIGEKSKTYHLNKTTECEKRGIKLIHIFENEWFTKKDIVKSRLKHALKCNHINKIFARRCEIREISPFIKNIFLKTHHLQGEDRSSIAIGAYYNNELVSVMTFGNLRIALGNKIFQKNEYEMYRFCSSKNIVGIAGKLLSYFIKKHNPSKIVTFADRRYSGSDAFYSSIGFSFVTNTPPNYYYFNKNDPYKLYHRYNFRKDQLSQKLEKFDINLTEWENMQLNGYDRIWDCGHMKFEWIEK